MRALAIFPPIFPHQIALRLQTESFMNWTTSIAWPRFCETISSLVMQSTPIAIACYLPSAVIAIGAFTGKSGVTMPPSEVRPGAIT